MLRQIAALIGVALKRRVRTSTTVTLSTEEWYEVRRALERAITREQNGLAGIERYPHFLELCGVKERAQHTLNIQESALKKMPLLDRQSKYFERKAA